MAPISSKATATCWRKMSSTQSQVLNNHHGGWRTRWPPTLASCAPCSRTQAHAWTPTPRMWLRWSGVGPTCIRWQVWQHGGLGRILSCVGCWWPWGSTSFPRSPVMRSWSKAHWTAAPTLHLVRLEPGLPPLLGWFLGGNKYESNREAIWSLDGWAHYSPRHVS